MACAPSQTSGHTLPLGLRSSRLLPWPGLLYSGSVPAQASASQEAFADHTAHWADLLFAFMASQASSAALITAIILHLFV